MLRELFSSNDDEQEDTNTGPKPHRASEDKEQSYLSGIDTQAILSVFLSLLIFSSASIGFINLGTQNVAADHAGDQSQPFKSQTIPNGSNEVVRYNGYTLLGGSNGVVYALADDGTTKWSWDVTSGSTTGIGNLAVTNDGLLAVSLSTSSSLKTYDISSKSVEFTKSTSNVINGLTTHNGVVYTIQDTSDKILGWDSSGTQVYSMSPTGGGNAQGLAVTDSKIVVGEFNYGTYAYDKSSKSKIWSVSTTSDASPVVMDGVVYVGTNNGDFYGFNLSDGSQTFSKTLSSTTRITELTGGDGNLYAASYSDSQFVGISTSDGSAFINSNLSTAESVAYESSTKHAFVVHSTTLDHYDTTAYTSYSKTVSGAVVNQDGNNVGSGVKVDVWAVNYNNINTESGQTKADRAKELIQKSTDPTPPNWTEKRDVNKEIFSKTDAEQYVAVHEFGGIGVSWVDGADLSVDRKIGMGQSVRFTVWDPDASTTPVITGEYEGQQPGVPVDGTVVVKKIGPEGDVVQRQELDTKNKQGGGFLDPTALHYAETRLPSGYYEVHAKDHPEASYQFKVGNPVSVFTQNLTSQVTNALTERASSIADLKSQNKVKRVTTTTNSDGSFSVDVPSSHKKVAIVAYSAKGLDLGPNTNLSDLRSKWENQEKQTSSIIISTEPTQVNPPASNVTVEVKEISSPGWADIKSAIKNYEFLRDYMDKESLVELATPSTEQLKDQLSSEQLKQLRDKYEKVLSQNQDLQSKYEQLKQDYAEKVGKSPSNLTKPEAVKLIEKAMAQQPDDIEFGEPQKEIKEGIVNATIPILTEYTDPSELLSTGGMELVVTAYHSDGSTHVLKEDQYSISNGGVQIDGYELPDSVQGATFSVSVAGESQSGETDVTVQNPATGGVPAFQFIDSNTISPVQGEQYSVSFNGKFQSVQDVTAIAPDGSTVNLTQSGDKWTFTPQQNGMYVLEVDATNSNGETVVYQHKIKGNVNAVDWPTSARLAQNMGGTYLVGAENVTGGSIEVAQEQAEVNIRMKDTSAKKVNVYAATAISDPSKNLKIQISKTDGSNVNEKKAISVYTERVSENSIIKVNGNYIEGSSSNVAIKNKGSTTQVIAYTDKSGYMNVQINNDPTPVERILYEYVYTFNVSDLNPVA